MGSLIVLIVFGSTEIKLVSKRAGRSCRCACEVSFGWGGGGWRDAQTRLGRQRDAGEVLSMKEVVSVFIGVMADSNAVEGRVALARECSPILECSHHVGDIHLRGRSTICSHWFYSDSLLPVTVPLFSHGRQFSNHH